MTYNVPSMTPEQVWRAIDALAEANNMCISRFAAMAGLHSTSLKQSERRNRYPNLRTVLLLCEFAKVSLVDFARLVESKA